MGTQANEQNKNVQGTPTAKEKRERTYSLTIEEIQALAENKEWLTAFKETAEALPVLTAKQVFNHTKPKA